MPVDESVPAPAEPQITADSCVSAGTEEAKEETDNIEESEPEREEETSTAETKYKAEYRRRIEELSRLMKEMDE